jgi:energy-coupling factor transporter transmembrane protein EcfT
MTWRPLAARCGPLSLLAVCLLTLVGSLWVDDLRTGLVSVAFELVLAPLAFLPTRMTWVRIGMAVLAALSVGWSAWLLGGPRSLSTGATASLRIFFFTFAGAVLLGHIEASALGDHLAQRLGLPGRPVVASVAALHRMADMVEDWRSLERARRVRGFGPGWSPLAVVRQTGALTFGLLVASLRRAGRMAVAMDARGFSSTTAHDRTWAEPASWQLSDSLMLVMGAALAGIPLLLRLVA